MMKKGAKPQWGSDSNMETLAAIVNQDRRNGNMTPGVAFARHVVTQHREQKFCKKDGERGIVVNMFMKDQWPESLSIVTMPSVHWRFEKAILRQREGEGKLPKKTFITAIEREPAIFTASLKYIPGADQGLTHLPGDIPKTHYTMKTPIISRYHLTSFEDFAEVNTKKFGGAWLDFTGPLTDRLFEMIPHFSNYIKRTLVITMLNARWSRDISDRVTRANGVDKLLASRMPFMKLEKVRRYQDNVPMIQLKLVKAEPSSEIRTEM